jgi:large subunit ribosomal protein L21
MFAIIRTGGKQYRVAKDEKLNVATIEGKEGDSIKLEDVLFAEGGKSAVVTATIVKHFRTPKILIFKKKKRQNYRRKNGHRQDMTMIQITDVKAG